MQYVFIYFDYCSYNLFNILIIYILFQSIYELGLLLGFSDERLKELEGENAQEVESVYAFAVKQGKITTVPGAKAKQKVIQVFTNLATIFPGRKKPRKGKDEIMVVCKVRHLSNFNVIMGHFTKYLNVNKPWLPASVGDN